MKKLFALICTAILTALVSTALAQTQQTILDVVTLKSGQVFKGSIIENTGESVKLKTENGNILMFMASEIQSITHEALPSYSPQQKQQTQVQQQQQFPATATRRTYSYRDPAAACMFSLIMPGMGQMYNGNYVRGTVFIVASLTGIGMMIGGICASDYNDYYAHTGGYAGGIIAAGSVLAAGSWLWSIIDAPISASLHNRANGLAHLRVEPTPLPGFNLANKNSRAPGYGLRLSYSF